MPSIRVEDEIAAPLDKVWKVVSDFEGSPRARGVPVEVDGQGVGAIRRVTIGSAVIVEKLESVDDESHSTSYSVVEGPLPVSDYLATIRLTGAGDSSTHIEWSSTFELTDQGDSDVVSIIERGYRHAIKGLQRYFAE